MDNEPRHPIFKDYAIKGGTSASDDVMGSLKPYHDRLYAKLLELTNMISKAKDHAAKYRDDLRAGKFDEMVKGPLDAVNDALEAEPATIAETLQKRANEIHQKLYPEKPSDAKSLELELRGQEIRNELKELSSEERRNVLAESVANGDDEILRAVEGAKITPLVNLELVKSYRSDFDRKRLEAMGETSPQGLAWSYDRLQAMKESMDSTVFLLKKKLPGMVEQARREVES